MVENSEKRRDWLGLIFRALYRMRYISIVAVICSFVGSALMFLMGTVKTVKALSYYLLDLDLGIHGAPGSAKPDLTQKLLVQSIDAFLFALVLMIFSFGIYNLFIKPTAYPAQERPSFWFDMRSVGHLKNTLAELIIIILFVKFLELVLLDLLNLTWETLILPVGIGFLAVALKLLDLRHEADTMIAAPDNAAEVDEERTSGESNYNQQA